MIGCQRMDRWFNWRMNWPRLYSHTWSRFHQGAASPGWLALSREKTYRSREMVQTKFAIGRASRCHSRIKTWMLVQSHKQKMRLYALKGLPDESIYVAIAFIEWFNLNDAYNSQAFEPTIMIHKNNQSKLEQPPLECDLSRATCNRIHPWARPMDSIPWIRFPSLYFVFTRYKQQVSNVLSLVQDCGNTLSNLVPTRQLEQHRVAERWIN